jgi:methionine-rich copper-binding protein CopC
MKILFSVFLFVLPMVAWAHATPIEYNPEASSRSTIAPERVTIQFSERVEKGASSIQIIDPIGKNSNIAGGKVPAENPRTFMQPFKDSGDGTYTVSWQVVSADDGHFTKGAYVFFVGSGTTINASTTEILPSFSIIHSSGNSEALAITAKLLGEDMLLGLFALLFLFGCSRALGEEARTNVARRARIFFFVSATILQIGALAYVGLKTNSLALVQETSLFHAFKAFAGTTAGICSWALIFLLPIFVFLARPLVDILPKGDKLSLRAYGAAIVFVVMSYTQARLSHAAASDILPTFSVFVNLFHLFGKGLWVGSLAGLLFVFLPALDATKAGVRTYRQLSNLFGKVIALALLLGGTSGLWIVWIHLKDPTNLMTSDWGHLFLLLSFFAVTLFGLRILSFFFLEQMKRCAACVRSFTLLETLTGLTVLFFSALIIITTPPLHHGAPWQAHSTMQGITMTLQDDGVRQNELLLTAMDKNGTYIDGTPIITATNQDANIGPLVLVSDRRFPGGYGLDTRLLSPSGTWNIAIAIERNNAYNANGKFTLDHPETLHAYRTQEGERTWGTFECQLVVLGVIIILLASLLFWFTKKNGEKDEEIIESDIVPGGNWTASIMITLLTFLLFVGIAYMTNKTFFVSPFQKLCIEKGGMWHQSVPMKNGKVLSPSAENGCMTGSGNTMSHHVDEREFRDAVGVAEESGIPLSTPMEGMEHMNMEH